MRFMLYCLVSTTLLFTGVGCFKTRAQLKADDTSRPERVLVAQRETRPAPPQAQAAARFEEYDEQLRHLSGRIDVVENSVQNLANKSTDRSAEDREKLLLNQRLLAYEEAFKKLEARIDALNEEVAKLKAPPPAPAPDRKNSGGHFEEGEELIAKKRWKDAIIAYQKYRDASPKGKLYAEATYRIGVCFQELGMKDEAKAFYDEVVAKFPKSKEAKKAATKSKSIK